MDKKQCKAKNIMKTEQLLFAFILISLQILGTHGQENHIIALGKLSLNLSFSPENLTELSWKKTEHVILRYTCVYNNDLPQENKSYNIIPAEDGSKIDIVIIPRDYAIAEAIDSNFALNCSGYADDGIRTSNQLAFSVKGIFLGKSVLDFYLSNTTNVRDYTNLTIYGSKFAEYNVTVINEETPIYTTFIVVVAIMVILLNFGFGCRIHLDVIKQILKRPFSPALGLFCQIVIMPLLGIAVTKIFKMEPVLGFGLFVVACAPGGSGSNVWTFLLEGDLDLSMTMTLISKTLALATMPGWMFALSRIYLGDDFKLTIPYTNIVTGLLSIALPLLFGMLLNKWKPNVAKKICKCLKPVSVLFILWVFIVGSLTNMYVYTIMANTWYAIPAGCLLSYSGMLFGLIIAKILRQPLPRIIAISIETGIQDSGIAILLFLSSFEKPLGSIASTMAIVVAMFTPIPPLIATVCLSIYKRCWNGGKCISCGGPEAEGKQVPIDDHDFVQNGTACVTDNHAENNNHHIENDTLPSATFNTHL